MWRFLLSVIAVLIVGTRVFPVLFPHDPWLDEAMLMANLPLPGVSAVLSPLPLYEQAAPPAYLLAASAVASWFPDTAVPALRALSACASLAGAGLVFLTLRRLAPAPVVAAGLALTCLTPFAVSYSVEIKHYIFEYLAAALMVYLSVRASQDPRPRTLLHLVAGGLVSITMSYTAPIVIAALGAGLAFQRWGAAAPGAKLRGVFAVAAPFAFLMLIAFGFYLVHTRPTTEILFAAHAYLYEPRLLSFPPRTAGDLVLWLRLPAVLAAQFWPWIDTPLWIRALWSIAVAVPLCVGIASLAKRAPLLPATLIAAGVLACGLSLAGAFPIGGQKHLAFMLPITGIILGFGLFACLRWIARRLAHEAPERLAGAGCAAVVALVAASGLVRATTLGDQQVSPLIAHIVSSDDADVPVWVYVGAQPAMGVLAPDTLDQIGLVPHASRAEGWMFQYPDDMRRAIRGLPSLWLVFIPFRSDPDDVLRYIAVAQEEVGGCRQVMETDGALLWKCN